LTHKCLWWTTFWI